MIAADLTDEHIGRIATTMGRYVYIYGQIARVQRIPNVVIVTLTDCDYYQDFIISPDDEVILCD